MDKLALIYRVPLPRSIYNMFRREIQDCVSVLDIGCGEESILVRLGFNHRQITGLDIWEDYAKRHQGDIRYQQYIVQDVLESHFPPKSFDMVLLSDVIEHIPKEVVIEHCLFNKVSQWARKKVVVMTPLGYKENEPYNGNPYLYHKSGWVAEELSALGFKVYLTYRVNRKKYHGIMLLEFSKTLFAVKEV